jgi:hypothetical protein
MSYLAHQNAGLFNSSVSLALARCGRVLPSK